MEPNTAAAGITESGTSYRRTGEGDAGDPAVVLVHGVGLDQALWQFQIPALGADRSVVTYDLLCHGESPCPEQPIGVADFVDQLGRLLDELAIAGPISLVGFSLGGLIARRFAAEHPHRISRLVLMSTVFERNPAQRAAVIDRYRQAEGDGIVTLVRNAARRWFDEDFRQAHPEIVEQIRQRMADNDAAAYLKAYAVFRDGDSQERALLQAIGCPTLVCTGSRDPNSTVAMATAMVDCLADARLEILDGFHHILPVEAPEQVAGLLDGFLVAGAQPATAEP